MKTLAGAVIAVALLGTAVAPAFAQAKPPRASTTQVKVFAEPG